MDKTLIKKAARKAERELRDRPRKVTRTLSLANDPFIKLQAICKAQEVSVSEAVDALIAAYVEGF